MNNKKHIIGLDQFRDILQIFPKVGNKKFVEPPLEKEILIFLASLGHSGDIKKITDVNVNKLHQPWRSFAAVINKCLSGTHIIWDFIFKLRDKNTNEGQCDVLSSVHHGFRNNSSLRQKDADDTLNTDIITSTEASQCPQGKGSSGKKEKQIDTVLGEYSLRQILTEAEQSDVIKRSCSRILIVLMLVVSGADEGTGVTPGFSFLSYDSEEDDRLCMMYEELTESDNDGDDFVHPKLTTHDDEIIHEEETDEDDSRISSSDDED
ncbi:hypothetical protein Tco_0064707 [Tanacetum coccineum]